MISSLLKNWGLGLQLLVGLLLVVLGTFPEPSEGLKCYTCEDESSEYCKWECESKEGYCFKWVAKSPAKNVVKSGCWTSGKAQCFRREFGGRDSVTETVPNKVTEAYKKSLDCDHYGREGQEQETNGVSFNACICTSDLCNTLNPGCDDVTTTTDGGNGGGGGGGDNGGGHSSSTILHIIMAVLPVALYNYT